MNNNNTLVSRTGQNTTLVGILVNLFLAIIKGVTGFLGNSYALIADAIESTTDIFTSAVVYSGLRYAARPPDAQHPYGHGKAEPLSAAFVAIMLIAAAVIITYQSIHEIITPHHAPEPFTLYILVLVVITKEILFRYVIKVGNKIDSIAVKVDAWHHRSDAITSFAAFVGISIALIGGEGYEEADDWAALFAASIIVINATRLFLPALRELMDTSPPENIELNIRRTASEVEGVIGLDKCRVRKMGFAFYIDLDILVDATIPVREGHDIAHKVKDKLLKSNERIANVLIHVEPFPRDI